ncbi:MAG: hypothetical protein ACRYG4_03895 [Janthinobacterium lividum]
MKRPSPTLVITLGLAGALWVMPSVGTQGMGTMGQRYAHPDRAVFDAVSTDVHLMDQAKSILQHADRSVEAAIGD